MPTNKPAFLLFLVVSMILNELVFDTLPELDTLLLAGYILE